MSVGYFPQRLRFSLSLKIRNLLTQGTYIQKVPGRLKRNFPSAPVLQNRVALSQNELRFHIHHRLISSRIPIPSPREAGLPARSNVLSIDGLQPGYMLLSALSARNKPAPPWQACTKKKGPMTKTSRREICFCLATENFFLR